MKYTKILTVFFVTLILLICLSACTVTSNNDDKSDNKIKVSEHMETEDKYSSEDTSLSQDNNISNDQNTDMNSPDKSSNTGSINTGSSNNSGNSGNSGNTGSTGNSGSTGSNEKPKEQHCHYETETYLVKDGYYENVLVKAGWTETVEECAAWTQPSRTVYVCNHCGYRDPSSTTLREHTRNCGTLIRDENPETGAVFEYWSGSSYHNETEIVDGDPICAGYTTTTVNHPAEYKQVWHDPEYGTRQVQVCD